MANIKMSDLGFGSLNNIQDGNSGKSGDRRRTSATTAIRMAVENAFSKDTLNNVTEFNGVVVSYRPVTYPSYSNKTALFNEYLIKNVPQDESAAAEEPQDYVAYAYKVYIPELEPRPAPCSSNDPVLITYPDVYSDIEDQEPLIELGTLVAVKFEDVENLFNPRIVRKVGGPIQIQNVASEALNEKFKEGIPLPLDSASPERKNLSSGRISQLANEMPDFTGETPNADKLRAALDTLGYGEKGDELSNAGDIKEVMADVGIAVFNEIKKQLPAVSITVTGGNDKYHKVIADADMYRSRHVDGVALDFVFSPVNSTNEAALLKILQGFSAANDAFRFKDEYTTLTSAASAEHFHFSFRSGGKEGKAEQAEAKDLLAQGLVQGYPLEGVS
jgi:hypothetical protein